MWSPLRWAKSIKMCTLRRAQRIFIKLLSYSQWLCSQTMMCLPAKILSSPDITLLILLFIYSLKMVECPPILYRSISPMGIFNSLSMSRKEMGVMLSEIEFRMGPGWDQILKKYWIFYRRELIKWLGSFNKDSIIK